MVSLDTVAVWKWSVEILAADMKLNRHCLSLLLYTGAHLSYFSSGAGFIFFSDNR